MNENIITKEYIKSSSISARFFEKVKKEKSCWIWTGAASSTKYGLIQVGGRGDGLILAHRLSWIIHHGKIPDGLCVLHDCPNGDNSLCVNPTHLWLGTQTENVKDMDKKGRRINNPPKGSENGNSKLSKSDVLDIKKKLLDGESCAAIARSLHVSINAIHHIKIGKNWGWLKLVIPV